jgi:5-methylthioadenosine/S-adenosylhomocysteine deaminase
VSDATFRRVSQLAAELELPVHVHVHETAFEVERSVAEHGVRPLARLAGLGLLGPQLISVHSVHLNDEEIALLARHGSSVAHCPSSNLKLASGIAPVAKLLAAGANVALGTDGAASNNRLDLFEEMRSAALLAKVAAGDAQAMPAHAALHAATLGGARALGLEARIGSLVPGKDADLAAVAMDDLALQPMYDLVSHLVYACGREHVTDVWVAGERQLRERELTRLDIADLQARAAMWQTKILN